MILSPKIKIGLLTDGENIPAWAWEMLRVIEAEGNAETVLVIINSSPKPSGRPSSLLYRAYRWLDRKLFKVKQDAFARKPVFTIPGLKANKISVIPTQKKFSDWIAPTDIDRIKEHQVDVLIRLGFRILKGDILTIAPLGVWSFHHGDNRVNRGGPPCFWEVMLGWHETGSVLQVLTEKLDAGTVLYRSWSRTDPLSVHRNANKVYWKSLHFVPRQLTELARIGKTDWQKTVANRQDKEHEYKHPVYTPPGNLKMLGLLIPFVFRNAVRKIKESLNSEFWQIHVGISSDELKPDVSKLKPISSPRGHYYADPFVVKRVNNTVIFFEDYIYQTKKAYISAGIWDGAHLQNVQPVVHEPFHLSYPFLFEVNGEPKLIAEMAEARKLILYSCAEWPYRWIQEKVIMDHVQGYDPTMIIKDGKYWLFMNQKPHAEASAFDELYLYYANSLDGTWNAHPKNPIVSDVKCARPAGRIFESNGKWYRPAQDCAKHYGHRIRLQEILEWNEIDYQETTANLIEPWTDSIQGTHTYNFTSGIFVLDSFSR